MRRSLFVVWTIGLAFAASAFCEDPLYARIDREIAKLHVGSFAPIANDAEFLRRLSLDLLGVIPSADDVRAFLADRTPDKRPKAIDRMLASDLHARRMADWFDSILMERRNHRWVPEAEFNAFLYEFYKSKKSYRELVRELLKADGADLAKRGSARFLLDRDVDPNVVTRDVARLFFGRDLQCAQCHDHPNVDDYSQREFQGIAAFVGRSYLFTIDENLRKAAIGEKAESDPAFKSVFLPGSRFMATPRLPGAKAPAEPSVAAGKEYKTKPDAKNRGVPTFSRRQLLADIVAQGDNIWFNRNIVNRLWSLTMGRGLVHPVDFHHSDNPATNPALLDILAADFAKHGHDIRYLLGQIARSQTYQRTVDLPADFAAKLPEIARLLPTLQQEESSAKAAVAQRQAAVHKAKSALKATDAELAAARKLLEAAEAKQADAAKAFDAVNGPFVDAKAKSAANEPAGKAVRDALPNLEIAVRALPADKELVLALASLKAKLKKLADEETASKRAIADLGPKIGPLRSKLDDAQQVRAVAAKPVDLAERKLADVRAIYEAALASLSESKMQWRHAQRKATAAQAAIELGQSAAARSQRLAKLTQADERIQGAIAVVEKSRREVELAKLHVSQADTQKVVAIKNRQESMQAVAERSKALVELASKLASLEPSATTAAQLATAAAGPAGANGGPLAEIEKLRIEVGRASASVERLEIAVASIDRRIAHCEHSKRQAETGLAAAVARVRQAEAEVAALRRQRDELANASSKLETGYEAAKTKLVEDWTSAGAVAALRPLTPDQLGWSALQATGVIANYRSQGFAELSKPKPPPTAPPAKPAEKNAKTAKTSAAKPVVAKPQPSPKPTAEQVDAWVYEKLKPSTGEFIRFFGASPGTPQDGFFSAADQALFFANGHTVNAWISPSGDNTAARAAKRPDAKGTAEEIYLAVLSRLPTADEIAEVADLLARNPKDKNAAIQQLVWSLIAGVEFRFGN